MAKGKWPDEKAVIESARAAHEELLSVLRHKIRRSPFPLPRRDDVAQLYATCIICYSVLPVVDSELFISFHDINYLIIEAWSMAGLKYIKERAWDEVHRRLFDMMTKGGDAYAD